jgi:hypothetical protein
VLVLPACRALTHSQTLASCLSVDTQRNPTTALHLRRKGPCTSIVVHRGRSQQAWLQFRYHKAIAAQLAVPTTRRNRLGSSKPQGH